MAACNFKKYIFLIELYKEFECYKNINWSYRLFKFKLWRATNKDIWPIAAQQIGLINYLQLKFSS